MPLYVSDTMGSIPGLTGLFVAGIFSAALSSVSPVLNSLAAVTMEDYLKVNILNYYFLSIAHFKIIIYCFVIYLAFYETKYF